MEFTTKVSTLNGVSHLETITISELFKNRNRTIKKCLLIVSGILYYYYYKSFFLNFIKEIQNGIATHKNRMKKTIAIPVDVPKKSLNIAPV